MQYNLNFVVLIAKFINDSRLFASFSVNIFIFLSIFFAELSKVQSSI